MNVLNCKFNKEQSMLPEDVPSYLYVYDLFKDSANLRIYNYITSSDCDGW